MLQTQPSLPEKLDARKQSPEEVRERRIKVIELYQEGVPVMEITKKTGLSWSAVNKAIKLHSSGGIDALLPQLRGRKEGTGRVLSEEQAQSICQYIYMRRPWYYRLKDSLWSTDTVMQLIEQKLGIKLSERGLSNYLKRWGIVHSVAKAGPYERCTKSVKELLDENYEGIYNEVQANNAEIVWMHTVRRLNQDVWTKIELSNKEADIGSKKRSIVSIENNQGKLSWIIIGESFGFKVQEKFLKNIIKDKGKKIYLIRCDEKIFSSYDIWFAMKSEKRVVIFPPLSATN